MSEDANYADDLSVWARVPSGKIPPASPIQKKTHRGSAIVLAATYTQDPKVLLEVSEDLVGAMNGLAVLALDEAQMLQTRGWQTRGQVG